MGRTPRKPTAFTDEHGTACLRVRLGRGQGYAIIDEESFDRLATNGVSERWNLNASSHGHGYVKSYRRGRGGRVSIAREVLGLRKGDGLWARHRDGNLRDLRRCNLYAERKRPPVEEFHHEIVVRARTSAHRRVPATARREPSPFTDEDGTPCLRVSLAKAQGEAIVEVADYAQLIAAGVSPRWSVNDNGTGVAQVKGSHPVRGPVSIAREIFGLYRGDERWVRFGDGGRLDLRRKNLVIDQPGGRRIANQWRR